MSRGFVHLAFDACELLVVPPALVDLLLCEIEQHRRSLGIGSGEPIVALRRLRLADDEPIAIETAALVRATGTAVF